MVAGVVTVVCPVRGRDGSPDAEKEVAPKVDIVLDFIGRGTTCSMATAMISCTRSLPWATRWRLRTLTRTGSRWSSWPTETTWTTPVCQSVSLGPDRLLQGHVLQQPGGPESGAAGLGPGLRVCRAGDGDEETQRSCGRWCD